MVTDKSRLTDGFLSLEGGIDSGLAPGLIDLTQCAWAVNTTFRGGWPTCRPGWFKHDIGHISGSNQGYFQGAGRLTDSNGTPWLCYSLSGRQFAIKLTDLSVTEFTLGAGNNPNQPHAWFQEAEGMVIVQDNESKPVIWDGVETIRAADDMVPVGGPMAYGQGRLWVASGNTYKGGDLVYSTNKGRKSILYFTENTFLNEGGYFAVPGPIRGMAFAANLDTALGTGDLLVFTPTDCFAFNAPVDRTVWKNLEYPLQRFALLDFGSANHESITPVNGDLFFRSQDGIRSLVYARRNFAEWGNTPISRQATRALKYDTMSLLYAASAINFDNRMLMTTQPVRDFNYGVWHRGLAVMDFYLVTGMGKKIPPAWEGAWTGLRILHVITQIVDGVQRAFMFVLNDDNEIELWEMSRADPFDHDGTDDVPIEWILETRSMTCGRPHDLKYLEGADHWYDELQGDVTVQAFYKRDNAAIWTPWASWEDSAPYRNCESATPPDCQTVVYYRNQSRVRVSLSRPEEVSDSQSMGFRHAGYEFQVRYRISGKLRLTRQMIFVEQTMETIYGDTTREVCVTQPAGSCETGDNFVEGCDPPDYNYNAAQVLEA